MNPVHVIKFGNPHADELGLHKRVGKQPPTSVKVLTPAYVERETGLAPPGLHQLARDEVGVMRACDENGVAFTSAIEHVGGITVVTRRSRLTPCETCHRPRLGNGSIHGLVLLGEGLARDCVGRRYRKEGATWKLT